MAFKRSTRVAGEGAAIEYRLGTNGEAYTLGEALILTSGRLTICPATSTPEFICVAGHAAETTAKSLVPVERVTELQEYDTVFSADGSAINTGDKVTIAADGLRATATVTSGVFQVSGKDPISTAGHHVTGYFRR